MAINWEEAPEGTTHATEDFTAVRHYGSWRKFEEGQWYYFKNGKWVFRSRSLDYLKNNPHIVGRPVEEVKLPNGLEWPEGYDHYNPSHGGLFFSEDGFSLRTRPRHVTWNMAEYEHWRDKGDTIARHKGKAAIAERPVEKPKKKVGWW